MIKIFAAAIVPVILGIVALIILFSKKPMYDAFIGGIKDGGRTALGLFPTLCALMAAIGLFSASGAAEGLAALLSGIGIPRGLAGFLIMRPISGGASYAMLSDIFTREGADSLTGLTASVIMATSDTLIYVISVYLGGAGIKKSRYTLPAALCSMIVTTAAAIIVCGIFFGGG